MKLKGKIISLRLGDSLCELPQIRIEIEGAYITDKSLTIPVDNISLYELGESVSVTIERED